MRARLFCQILNNDTIDTTTARDGHFEISNHLNLILESIRILNRYFIQAVGTEVECCENKTRTSDANLQDIQVSILLKMHFLLVGP